LSKYFRYEQGEFVEYNSIPNGYIKPIGECIVISILENSSNPKIDLICELVKRINIHKVIIDFISSESYIDIEIVKTLENELSEFELKILTVNLLNNQFKSHIFFPLHAFQIKDAFSNNGLLEANKFIQFDVLKTKKRLKKYLFLNHHIRTERFKLFESIYKNNNIKDGLVSFNWTLDHNRFEKGTYDISDNDMNYIINSDAYKLLPLELDGSNNSTPRFSNITPHIANPVYFQPQNTNITHFHNTYFEIITEGFSSKTPVHTFADRTNILHYSEKIYKPLFFMNPFCFWGPENTLEQFSKWFGFSFESKLYHCNNDYDLESFCKKINELINLSYDDIHSIYYNSFDELLQNRNILLNYLNNIKL
jgi:hypothetical protein